MQGFDSKAKNNLAELTAASSFRSFLYHNYLVALVAASRVGKEIRIFTINEGAAMPSSVSHW